MKRKMFHVSYFNNVKSVSVKRVVASAIHRVPLLWEVHLAYLYRIEDLRS